MPGSGVTHWKIRSTQSPRWSPDHHVLSPRLRPVFPKYVPTHAMQRKWRPLPRSFRPFSRTSDHNWKRAIKALNETCDFGAGKLRRSLAQRKTV